MADGLENSRLCVYVVILLYLSQSTLNVVCLCLALFNVHAQ